ncbi:MAG: DUF4418 family protein [Clostridia bacterium]|nr:DUF4418 family protein [Clostridia bacterium]
MEMKRNYPILEAVILVLSLVLLIGLMTFLQPCGPREDGSWMNCHWAGEALKGVAGVLTIQAAALLFARRATRRGLAIGMIPTAILAILLPGQLIPLCVANTHQCQAVTRPAALVLGVLIAILALAEAIRSRKE